MVNTVKVSLFWTRRDDEVDGYPNTKVLRSKHCQGRGFSWIEVEELSREGFRRMRYLRTAEGEADGLLSEEVVPRFENEVL